MIKKMKLIVTPLALAMALSGCMSLAPKYERPAAPVAPAFPELPKAGGTTLPTATTEAPSNLSWQRFFADARLRQLIELSLANNRDLRVSILNIEQARAQYRITRADRAPTVSASFPAAASRPATTSRTRASTRPASASPPSSWICSAACATCRKRRCRNSSPPRKRARRRKSA